MSVLQFYALENFAITHRRGNQKKKINFLRSRGVYSSTVFDFLWINEWMKERRYFLSHWIETIKCKQVRASLWAMGNVPCLKWSRIRRKPINAPFWRRFLPKFGKRFFPVDWPTEMRRWPPETSCESDNLIRNVKNERSLVDTFSFRASLHIAAVVIRYFKLPRSILYPRQPSKTEGHAGFYS